MSNPFLHNYHSHTTRCGHASGADEKYVIAAMEAGFKTIGFSDHVMLPGIHQEGMRGDISLLEDYIQSVNELKKKYAGQIDVKLGFECEYSRYNFSDYYHELLEQRGFDYLILGQHCSFDPGYGSMRWYPDMGNRKTQLYMYTKDLIDGMESGLFAYVAHPDFFMLLARYWDEETERISREICEVAERLHIPLELNMGRTRGSDAIFLMDEIEPIYPFPAFWRIVSEYNIDVIVGVDAHKPSHYRTSDYEAFAEILRKFNLKWKQKLDI